MIWLSWRSLRQQNRKRDLIEELRVKFDNKKENIAFAIIRGSEKRIKIFKIRFG